MKNITFSIKKGEFVVILGDTGSGSYEFLIFRKIIFILWSSRINELPKEQLPRNSSNKRVI